MRGLLIILIAIGVWAIGVSGVLGVSVDLLETVAEILETLEQQTESSI